MIFSYYLVYTPSVTTLNFSSTVVKLHLIESSALCTNDTLCVAGGACTEDSVPCSR